MTTGVISFRDKIVIYEVSETGHLGAKYSGCNKPVAVTPDIRAAIEADVAHQIEKEKIARACGARTAPFKESKPIADNTPTTGSKWLKGRFQDVE